MQPAQDTDYKKLLTEVIQKQMVILGPGITLAKARNVKGLVVDDAGTVTAIDGPPQELIQGLIDQFVQLSGLIVRKTMEPLLSAYPDGGANLVQPPQVTAPPPPAPQEPKASAAQEAINQALGNTKG
ncbi:MAG: hypothetical protein M1444_01540 [Patescibacteria group bacterium]|nr:hypothetical protein [Patescibacteria group bacterium]